MSFESLLGNADRPCSGVVDPEETPHSNEEIERLARRLDRFVADLEAQAKRRELKAAARRAKKLRKQQCTAVEGDA